MIRNKYPPVCAHCGAILYGATLTPVKCPKCGKPWKEKNPAFLTKTPAQRRAGYHLAKGCGLTSSQAQRVRQWRSPKMFRMLGLPVPPLRERRAMGLVNPQWRPTESPQSKAMIKAEEAMIIKGWLDKIRIARDPAQRMNVIRDLVRQARTGKVSFDIVRKIVSQGGLLSELSMMLKSKTLNPMAQMLRLTTPLPCSLCGKPVKDRYIIKDREKFYHLKCFQTSRQKNPKLGSRTHLESHPTKQKAYAALLTLQKNRPDRVHRMWYSDPYQRWVVVASYIPGEQKNPRQRKYMVDGRLKLEVGDRVKLTKKSREAVVKFTEIKNVKPSDLWIVKSIHYDVAAKYFGVVINSSGNELYMNASALIYYDSPNKNPTSLYESFHGTSPLRTRKVMYEPPPTDKPLVKVGRLSQLNYVPEHPSKKAGTEFYHVSGDTGEKTLKSNLLLATDQRGRNLYLLRDGKSQFPKFTERGIIG